MDRWWADPDKAVRMLALVDEHYPVMGVGTAVLGHHALAKAALSPLAESTLADAVSITEALSKVDLEPVELAIEAALDEQLGAASERFSQLLVKSLHEEATNAAVRLSRTLVNKGLPWPRAMARTADVVGAPLSSLSAYASAMAAPGLDPLSVADAADRVLMTHASRVGCAQASVVSVVSKAERERTRPAEVWDETKVRRDEDGRFAELDQAVGLADEERQARRERRKRRQARWAAQGEQSSQSSPRVASKVARQPQERASSERTSGGRPSSDRAGSDRASLPMYSRLDAPDLDAGEVFTLDDELWVIQGDEVTEKGITSLVARTPDDAESYLRHRANQTGHKQTASAWRFSPGSLPLDGYWRDRNVFVVNSTPSGGKLVSTKKYFSADAEPTYSLNLYEGSVAKDDRPRERVKAHSTGRTWDETKVRRDEIGRFAEVAEEAEIAEQAARKERRKRRAARQARADAQRAAAAPQAQRPSAERGGRERPSAERQGSQRAGSQRKSQERAESARAYASHVRGLAGDGVIVEVDPAAELERFVRPLGDNAVMANLSPDFYDNLFITPNEYSRPVTSLAGKLMAGHKYNQGSKPARPGDIIAPEQGPLMKMIRWDAALNGTHNWSADPGLLAVAQPIIGPNQVVVEFLRHGIPNDSMLPGLDLSDTEPLADTKGQREVLYNTGALRGSAGKTILGNLDSNGQLELRDGPPMGSDDRVILLADERTMRVLDLVGELTHNIAQRHYKSPTSDLLQARKAAFHAAARQKLEPPRTDFDCAYALLKDANLAMEFADGAVYMEMAKSALTSGRGPQVRLDGLDVVRITPWRGGKNG